MAIWAELTSAQIKSAEDIRHREGRSCISISDTDCSAERGDIVLAVTRGDSPTIRFGVVANKYPDEHSSGDYLIKTQHGINPLYIPGQIVSFGSPAIVINFTCMWNIRRAGRVILKAFRRYKALTEVLKLCMRHNLPMGPLVGAVRSLSMLASPDNGICPASRLECLKRSQLSNNISIRQHVLQYVINRLICCWNLFIQNRF